VASGQTSPAGGNGCFRLTRYRIFGEARDCQISSFPGLRRVARPASEAGCVVFWASARSRRLWTSRQAAAKCSVHQIGDPQDVAGSPYKPDAVSQFSAGVRDRKWRDFPATRSRVHGKLSPASPCRRVHRFAAHASSPRPAKVPWRGAGRHAGGQSRRVGARLKCHWLPIWRGAHARNFTS